MKQKDRAAGHLCKNLHEGRLMKKVNINVVLFAPGCLQHAGKISFVPTQRLDQLSIRTKHIPFLHSSDTFAF